MMTLRGDLFRHRRERGRFAWATKVGWALLAIGTVLLIIAAITAPADAPALRWGSLVGWWTLERKDDES